MACFGEYWLEFQHLSELATPSMLTNVLEAMLVVEDVAILGRLGRGHVAALAVGNAVFNLVWYFIEGIFTAQDTLGSIAFAQHDLRAVRYWTYASLGCVLSLCAIATALYVCGSDLLLEKAFFISPHIRTKAVLHVYFLTPSVWFLGLFRVLQKYLACQNIMQPTTRALLLGNALNIALNFLFIFGLGFGFIGCAVSTTISRLAMLIYLYKQVRAMTGFVHIRTELRALVRHTPAQSVVQHAAVVEDAIYGARVERTVGRVHRTLAAGLEFVGVHLHIKSLAQWARRWGQDKRHTDDAEEEDRENIELESLIGLEEESQTRKPQPKHRRSGRVVPFDSPLVVPSPLLPPAALVLPSASSSASESASLDISGRANERKLASLSASSPSNARTGGFSAPTVHFDMDGDSAGTKIGGGAVAEAISTRVKRSLDKRASNYGDEGEGEDDEEEEDDNDDDDDEDDEESMSPDQLELARRTSRGPRMLMLIRALRFLAIGVPGGLVCGLETWVFAVLVLLVQRTGTVPMVASVIGLVMMEAVYLAVPFALQVACTLRVSQLLAEKKPERATVACTVCMLGGCVFVGLTGLMTYYLPGLIGLVFTTDQDVIFRLKKLSPYLAGYQVLWGLGGIAQSVLRAQARQMEVVAFLFICLWLIGLPLGWWWGFKVRPTHGLYGYWAGLLVGQGLLTLILVLMVLASDWAYSSRVVVYRAEQEKEGFAQPSATNMWMSKAIGISNAVYSPVGHITTPQVGRPSVGSRAVGGFDLGAASLEEVLDETDRIEIKIGEDAASDDDDGGGDAN